MKPSKPGHGGPALADRVPASQALHAAALLALGDEIARQLAELAHDGLAAGATCRAPLTQVAGALHFAGEQSGAALVELLVTAMERHASGPFARAEVKAEVKAELEAELEAELNDITANVAGRLCHALRSRALGHTLPIAHWLPCWQRLAALVADADAHPCQLLTLAPNPDLATLTDQDVPHAMPELQVAIDLLVCEVDRALLDFLRSCADSMRQHAANTIAVALAGIAARQPSPQDRLRWRVLQAFAVEVSAGQYYELEHTKRILSATGRQVRQVQRMLHHVPPDSLLREALFEIAQRPCLTALAQQMADAHGLASQFPVHAGQGASPLTDDEVFERDWTALQVAMRAAMGITNDRVTAAAWSSPNDRSLTDMAAGCRTGPALPMASSLMRATAEALRESIAAIEHQIDPAGECGPLLKTFDEVRDLVSQIDACTGMLDHAGLRAAASELKAALAQLSPVASVGGEAADIGERLGEFAARLVALEAALALLPFSSSVNVAGISSGIGPNLGNGANPGSPTLQQIFMSEARARLDSLSVALATWTTMPAAGLPLQASIDAHTITGSSATVGWTAIHALAQPLELACAACEARPFATEDAGLLADVIAALRSLLDEGIAIAGDDSGHRIDTRLIASLQALARAPSGKQAGEQAGAHLGAQAAELPEVAQEPAAAPDSELIALFNEEAADLLPQLHHAMRAWLSRPDDPAPPSHLMRVLHTLKGSARMAGQTALGNAMHDLESQVATIVDARPASADSLRQLQCKLDDALQFAAMYDEPVRDISGLIVNATAASPVMATATAAPFLSAHAVSKEAERGASRASTSTITSPNPNPNPSPSPSQGQGQGQGQGHLRLPVYQLGRMTDAAAGLLSGLYQQSDEMLTLRQGVTDLADNLARLRTQLRELEIEADARIDARERRNDDAAFDPLEFDRYTRVHELTRAMSESVADIAELQRMVARQTDAMVWSTGLRQRHARALHADLLNAGTSPFGSLQQRLSQALRQAVRDTGGRVDAGEAGETREVMETSGAQEGDHASAVPGAPGSPESPGAPEARLVLEGGELALDRSLLTRLAAPLEHLIRNAIAHGIESPAERERLGKPRTGTLRLSLSRSANQWQLEVADDGRGLDAARIRARAAAMGLAVPAGCPHDDEDVDDGIGVDEAAAAELIFAYGLSTSDALTPLAGRGVGMDTVRAAVQSLGGAIAVRSEPGRGCCFVLALPLTLAILPVLVCRAGPHLIGVPSAMVEQVLKLDGPAFAAATEGEAFAWQGQACRWRMLATLLGTQPAAPVGAGRRKTVLLLSQASGRLALVVDAVDARRELTLRDPGPQLLSVPGMIAASPAADGRIVLVMNPFSLALAGHPQWTAQGWASSDAVASMAATAATAAATDAATPAAQPPVILVVDDSLTVRRATQRLLQRHGYTVLLARDGAEALALLAGTDGATAEDADLLKPQAVLLDIEMPKMDGFDLLSVLRDDTRWQHLPVVMITSRTADRHRERALQLGANAYVGKPYREDELLTLLAGLLPAGPTACEPAASISSCAA